MKRYEVMNLGTAAIERLGYLFPAGKSIFLDLSKKQKKMLSEVNNLSVMEIEIDYIIKEQKDA
jgi:hypothetical protein